MQVKGASSQPPSLQTPQQTALPNLPNPPTNPPKPRKDYLQSLQDDSKINVEKIGSGNWYWSFPSETHKLHQLAHSEALTAHAKTLTAVQDLRTRVSAATAQRQEDDETLNHQSSTETRASLSATHVQLSSELSTLRAELAAYSDSDPTELERKGGEVAGLRAQVEGLGDEICGMEQWLRERVGDPERMAGMLEELYGREFDVETGSLREVV